MWYRPVVEDNPEVAGIRVEATSFRQAEHLILDCFALRAATRDDDNVQRALTAWTQQGRPILREDGIVWESRRWHYHFTAETKAWLAEQLAQMEAFLARLGYPTDYCNPWDGVPRYDGDAVLITLTGTARPPRPDLPSILLGLRLAEPDADWTYVSGGPTVALLVHPTLEQAKDRLRELTRRTRVLKAQPVNPTPVVRVRRTLTRVR